MMRYALIPAAALLLAFPRAASATWSITAVDPRTREVGIAGASCTPDVLGIAGVVPSRGVIAAQAPASDAARQRGVEMLRIGVSPAEIVRTVTDSAFDPGYAAQQYGIVALDHAPAVYTGAATEGWKGHEVGADVSVQGNILVGPQVLRDAMAAFRTAAEDSATTLADRLLLALEAGAAAGGDARCPGHTALSAFLIVAGPNDRRDAQHLRLYVNGQAAAGANPVGVLRERYDEWRRLIRSHAGTGSSAWRGPTRMTDGLAVRTMRSRRRRASLAPVDGSPRLMPRARRDEGKTGLPVSESGHAAMQPSQLNRSIG